MRVHPNDLAILNKTLPTSGVDTQMAGWAAAFLRICKLLEDDLVLADGERTEWLKGVGDLDFNLERVAANTKHTALSLGIKSGTFRNLQRIAENCWRGPAQSIRELPFMTDSALRGIAERDLASLAIALKSEQTKAALLLAGCVVEALLLDVVEANEAAAKNMAALIKTKRQTTNPRLWRSFDPGAIDNWSFYHLVAICSSEGLSILSDRTERIADTIRDSRNFVHPRKERDELSTGNLVPSDAIAASALAEIVIDEVRGWKGKNP